MRKYRCQGAITVFLSILSVMFLSLICTLAESARVQGTRARAAAVTDMGLFSLFGEYEPELLEKYDVLFLDGAYGNDEFMPERTALKLRDFMSCNADPKKDLNLYRKFNIFPLEISDVKIEKYTLATDENGEAFYQQAVKNLKENLGSELLGRYAEDSKKAKEQETNGKAYEDSERIAQEQLEAAEAEAEAKAAAEAEAGSESESEEETENTESTPVSNPLDTLKEIKNQGILGLVVKDSSTLSDKQISLSKYPSGRTLKQGNLPVIKVNTGIIADGLFQDYLIRHFSDMSQKVKGSPLDYQLEYILMGKDSDVENLKAVVHRLLLMREGVNFLYAIADTNMRSETDALALAITTSVGLPALTTALSTALLLGWAYGESLMDVRTLLAGGKVPLVKTKATWKLSLENLGRLTEILEECDTGGGEGQSYEDYIRTLLLIGKKDKYPLRALDMIEGADPKSKFKADHLITKVETITEWNLPPVFLRVSAAFLGTGNEGSTYEVQGSFAY